MRNPQHSPVDMPAPPVDAPGVSPAPTELSAAARYWVLAASHSVVDVFPIMFIALMIALQNRLGLSEWQVAVVYMITPVFSGGCQPLLAWLGDRYDTRIAGPLGLALGAVCVSSIGFAQNFWQLIALQIVGVIGTGMYHPAAAALAGQLGAGAFRRGRGFAVSVFITAGMLGQALGPIVSTRINDLFGMGHLLWLAAPGLLMAIVLHKVAGKAKHRHDNHREIHASIPRDEAALRKRVVGVLAAANALRFVCNIGLFTLLNYWAKMRLPLPQQADTASNISGNLTAAVTVGMGVFGLAAGRLIRPGSEKWAFVLSAFLGAVFVASVGIVGDLGWNLADGAWWGLIPAYIAAAATAIGFFATIPISIGVAQRLLPGHTALASALMMGFGWMISAAAPPIAQQVVGLPLERAAELEPAMVNRGFFVFAGLLVAAAALSLTIPSSLLKRVAHESH